MIMPWIGAPAARFGVMLEGSSVLHGLGPNADALVSTIFLPVASQHASTTSAGLLAITFFQSGWFDPSAQIASSHRFICSNRSSVVLLNGETITWLPAVPFWSISRWRSANE